MSNQFEGRLVIGDDTPTAEYEAQSDGRARGLIPRDYSAYPVGFYAAAPAWDMASLPLVPWDEIPDRIAHMEETKTRLIDLVESLDPLDQNGQGFCWFYSGTAAIHCLRMRNNQPNVRLSAHSGACVIKNFRDEGGWGAQGLDFQKERGVVPVSRWPEKSMDRQYNTEANWEAAKEFRPVEGFVDLNSPQYDRELTVQQIISCYLNRIPVISDFNWWGHSVCGLWMYDYKPNLRKNDPNRYAANEILNSWGRGWGQNGRGILKDSKAFFFNGASAPRATWGN
jgi:hypothetical protein